MYKKNFLLFLIVFLSVLVTLLNGMKVAVLPELNKPEYIIMDEKQLIVADYGKQLHLYSMKDFKYQKQLFKKGEGPSEAPCLGFVRVTPEFIYSYCMGKNLFFSRDGRFVKGFRIPPSKISYIFPVKDKYVIETYKRKNAIGELSMEISLSSCNSKNEMQYEKLLYYYEIPHIAWKGNRRPLLLIKHERNTFIFENRIFICDSERGLYVQVYDLDGNRLYNVKLDSEKLKVGDDYSQESTDKLKEAGQWESFNSQFYYELPEYFPAFFRFYVGKNKFYFLTYKKIGNNREVVICDWKGKNVKKTFIPWVNYGDLRNYYIWNNKFYWLVDNEEREEWELHAVDVN